MLIAFDGIDGSGKTTLSQKVYSYLANKELDVKLLDMGSFGFIDEYLEEIKNNKQTVSPEIRELLFYFEGNLLSDHIKNTPQTIFITDRYFLTYYAYGAINGFTQDKIHQFCQNMIHPDFYFFMDVTPEITLKRIQKYRKITIPEIGYSNKLSENEENNKKQFLEVQKQIYMNYKTAIKNWDYDVYCIDGTQEQKIIEDKILDIIAPIWS